MKLLSVFAIILAVAACQGAEIAERVAASERSVSSLVVDLLEAMKLQMPHGWPEYGIPVLAPAQMSHKALNFGNNKIDVNNVVINGLDEFEIRILHFNLPRSRINFEFNFANLNVTTKYEADVDLGYHMTRNGGAFMALEDLNVSGEIRYSSGIIGSKLRVKQIMVDVKVRNVISNIENLSKYRILNRKMNEVVEEFISLTIYENSEFISNWIDGTVTPIANDFIGDRSLQDLLDLIGGGGGSN